MLVLTSISTECFAKGWDDGLRHIDVYVNGTITVDTQVNGVSQANQSKELEFHDDTSSFTKSATITITGTMKSEELGINTSFTKVVSGGDIDAAVEENQVTLNEPKERL